MDGQSRVWTDADFGAIGKQISYLHLPHSVTRSALGTIDIPISIIASGSGPTVLLMAGIHGDEYEAQIALCRLIREIEPEHIAGRVIILPAMNLPAVMAGTRVSPIDDLNLNRCFPGNPDGRPTEQIAYLIDSILLPQSDVWLDWHSGGGSLDYLPFASIHRFKDQEHNARNVAALEVFGAPLSVVWSFFDEPRMAKGCAEHHKLTYLGSEFGGGGSVNVEGIALAYEGTLRVLHHLGVLDREAPFEVPPPRQTRYVDIAGRDYSTFAPAPGVFEPTCRLGDEIQAEQCIGYVHFVDDPARPAIPVHTARSGTLLCLRHPGRTERGDCLAQIAKEIGKPVDERQP